MELSLKYSYCWLWRFLAAWSAREFEIGFYDVDCETQLWCVKFGRANKCVERTVLHNDPISREWDTPEEDKAWANL